MTDEAPTGLRVEYNDGPSIPLDLFRDGYTHDGLRRWVAGLPYEHLEAMQDGRAVLRLDTLPARTAIAFNLATIREHPDLPHW